MGACTNYGCNAKIMLDGPFEPTTAMEYYRVVDVPYGQAFLFNTHNEATAKLAFICDNESNLLVGAAAMGSDAGPWIDVLSLVIFNKMTREQFADYLYAFPTPTCGPLMMLGMFW